MSVRCMKQVMDAMLEGEDCTLLLESAELDKRQREQLFEGVATRLCREHQYHDDGSIAFKTRMHGYDPIEECIKAAFRKKDRSVYKPLIENLEIDECTLGGFLWIVAKWCEPDDDED